MITGIHVLFFSEDAPADRRFVRDVLGFATIDVGDGWLIFSLPPAEAAIHPGAGDFAESTPAGGLLPAHVYLMCNDLDSTISGLRSKDVVCSEVRKEAWGLVTSIPLPSGQRLGLYQPFHPTALDSDALRAGT